MIDLRLGNWQDVLADVECDALICDPPYGARVHGKHRSGARPEMTGGRHVVSRSLGYTGWSREDVEEFVKQLSPRTRGWLCVFTSVDLAMAYVEAFESVGRCAFPPISCVQVGMNVRLSGDGPSNWTTLLVVSRPRSPSFQKWGTLPGAYVGNPFDPGQNTATATRRSSVVGSKPLWLMRAIVRDYSRPGDIVCDPCAGGATTLLAAAIEGRRAIGSEMDPKTYELAQKRIAKGYTPATLFDSALDRAEQTDLLTKD